MVDEGEGVGGVMGWVKLWVGSGIVETGFGRAGGRR